MIFFVLYHIHELICCFYLFSDMMESIWIEGTIGAIKALAFVCDIITYPVYLLLQRPWEKKRLSRRIKVIVPHSWLVNKLLRLHFLSTSTFFFNLNASCINIKVLFYHLCFSIKNQSIGINPCIIFKWQYTYYLWNLNSWS